MRLWGRLKMRERERRKRVKWLKPETRRERKSGGVGPWGLPFLVSRDPVTESLSLLPEQLARGGPHLNMKMGTTFNLSQRPAVYLRVSYLPRVDNDLSYLYFSLSLCGQFPLRETPLYIKEPHKMSNQPLGPTSNYTWRRLLIFTLYLRIIVFLFLPPFPSSPFIFYKIRILPSFLFYFISLSNIVHSSINYTFNYITIILWTEEKIVLSSSILGVPSIAQKKEEVNR